MTFEIGNTVQLKSGGPSLTVISVDETTIQCRWFDATGVLHRDFFEAGELTKSDFAFV